MIIGKNSTWLSTSIMTDRETPLAEIVGQLSLSKEYTDASTISWVFISVNNDLTKLKSVYIHIERRELKAGDDVNGNNVMGGGGGGGGLLIIEAMCMHHALMIMKRNMGMY